MAIQNNCRLQALTHEAIAEKLYAACYLVESQIVGQKDEDICVWWAKKNAFRHAFTASKLLQLARDKDEQPITILNLSGLSCGHQDFALCAFLQSQGVSFKYFALEHPSSPHLSNAVFKDEVTHCGIDVFFADLRELSAKELQSRIGNPDVILFTEIAEHLEHSTLLKAFQVMSALLPETGRIILTTPNMDYWWFRFRHLMGKPAAHWGEGLNNMDSGLFGHIVYYGIPRLRSLLGDCGLTAIQASTFSFPYATPGTSSFARFGDRIGLVLINGLIRAGKHLWRFPTVMNALIGLGEVIYMEVRTAPRRAIPFAL